MLRFHLDENFDYKLKLFTKLPLSGELYPSVKGSRTAKTVSI